MMFLRWISTKERCLRATDRAELRMRDLQLWIERYENDPAKIAYVRFYIGILAKAALALWELSILIVLLQFFVADLPKIPDREA